MFMILVLHSIVFMDMSDISFPKCLLYDMEIALCRSGVNVFVLLTGYFLCKDNQNFRKIYMLVASILFFNILLLSIKPISSHISILNSSGMFRLGSYIGKNSLTIFMSHMLFYYMYKFVFDNNVFNGFYIFHKHHFLLQGVVFLTVSSTILTCKWQSLQL